MSWPLVTFVGGAALGAGALYYLTRRRGCVLFGQALPTTAALDKIPGPVGVHVRQLRRYAFAASQDKSPIVGLTHASYALILLDTLEEIVGREAIQRLGYDPAAIRQFIAGTQDRHAAALEKCDGFMTNMLGVERGLGVAAAPRGA